MNRAEVEKMYDVMSKTATLFCYRVVRRMQSITMHGTRRQRLSNIRTSMYDKEMKKSERETELLKEAWSYEKAAVQEEHEERHVGAGAFLTSGNHEQTLQDSLKETTVFFTTAIAKEDEWRNCLQGGCSYSISWQEAKENLLREVRPNIDLRAQQCALVATLTSILNIMHRVTETAEQKMSDKSQDFVAEMSSLVAELKYVLWRSRKSKQEDSLMGGEENVKRQKV